MTEALSVTVLTMLRDVVHVLRRAAPVRTLVSGARDKNTSALYIASSSLLVCYSKNKVHSLDIASPECLRHT